MAAEDEIDLGLPADTFPIEFGEHAVERWVERIRPGMDLEEGRRELSRLLHTGRVLKARPDWVTDHGATRFLCFGDEICLPLMDRPGGAMLASTCMFRGSLGLEYRQARNDARVRVADGKRGRRLAMGRRSRPQASGPTIEEFGE